MGLPVPSAKEIAARMAASLEAAVLAAAAAIGTPADPDAVSRAVRSARGVMAMILRATALELRSLYAYLSWWVRQWFVDTADDEAVIRRHAAIWGIEPRPATKAIGAIVLSGQAGAVIAQATKLTAAGGVDYVTGSAVTIASNGTAEVAVTALIAGAAGNLEAGISLSPSPAIAAINTATVGDGGIDGGADDESVASLQMRTIAHIRERPHGGAGFDYPRWLSDAFDVQAVKVLPDWIGRGSVGLAVSMTDDLSAFGRAPNEIELTAMLDYLGAPGAATGVRPVTAHVAVFAATAQEQPLTVRLRPDTAQNRLAVTEAWTLFLQSLGNEDDAGNESPIGALIELSRLGEALSSADGEYAHDLIVPADNVQLAQTAYAVAGAPTFVAGQ